MIVLRDGRNPTNAYLCGRVCLFETKQWEYLFSPYSNPFQIVEKRERQINKGENRTQAGTYLQNCCWRPTDFIEVEANYRYSVNILFLGRDSGTSLNGVMQAERSRHYLDMSSNRNTGRQ